MEKAQSLPNPPDLLMSSRYGLLVLTAAGKSFLEKNKCIFFEIEIKTSLSHCVTKNDLNEQSVLVHVEEKLQNFFRVWHSERAIEVVGRRSDLVTRSWAGNDRSEGSPVLPSTTPPEGGRPTKR